MNLIHNLIKNIRTRKIRRVPLKGTQQRKGIVYNKNKNKIKNINVE